MKEETDPITDLCIAQSSQRLEAVTGNINSNLVGAEDGQLTVTVRLKLSLVKGRAYCKSTITIPQEKISNEGEDSCDVDVNQIKLAV